MRCNPLGCAHILEVSGLLFPFQSIIISQDISVYVAEDAKFIPVKLNHCASVTDV